jgi:hypothetical protein
VLPHENTTAEDAKKLVFHCVGDTGGIHGDNVQVAIAEKMEAQITAAGSAADKPAFLYHLGDVVYFNGLSRDYSTQFYEPYKHYPAAIFAIPGNHDGDTRVRKNDEPDDESSLFGFMTYFCDTRSRKIFPYRPTMTQPYCYWTLETPFVDVIGLYSNVEGSLDARGTNEQQYWFEDQLRNMPPDKWVIIAVHHSPFSLDGSHGGYPDILASIDRAVSSTGRVPDAVLSGHVHNYQRFSRKVGNKTVPYIVAGAGGYANTAKLLHQVQREVKGVDPVLPMKTLHDGKDIGVTLENFNDKEPGFLRITVTPAKLDIEYFLVPFDGEPGDQPFDAVPTLTK